MFFQENAFKKKTVEGWVRAYSREFYNYAFMRLRKHEEAEDVVQTTFVRAFRSFSSFKQGSNEKAWLYAILGNAIKDIVRQASAGPQYKAIEEDDLVITEQRIPIGKTYREKLMSRLSFL